METVLICCDVDGTLIDSNDAARTDTITLLRILSTYKNVKIVIWSGSGKQYAERRGHSLGLDKLVWRYASKTEVAELGKLGTIMAIDDMEYARLGLVNLVVSEAA